MTAKCPCCGSETGAVKPDALSYINLPKMAKKTLEVLIASYPRALSRNDIASRVYCEEPSGGPDTAETAVSVYMLRMRPKLVAAGWTVGWDTEASGIRLRPLASNQAGQSL
jgi:hypothetical protein